jgi:putative membrane protein
MSPILPEERDPELKLSANLPRPPYDTTDEKSVELSSRRTGMSFQRTRMSADRTLMSIIRTALSLISFGFTIFQVFKKMQDSKILEGGGNEPRNFGIALVLLGMVMLTLGIVYHIDYMRGLRAERVRMIEQGLVHGESKYPVSLTLITAALLWLLGLVAAASMAFNVPLLG